MLPNQRQSGRISKTRLNSSRYSSSVYGTPGNRISSNSIFGFRSNNNEINGSNSNFSFNNQRTTNRPYTKNPDNWNRNKSTFNSNSQTQERKKPLNQFETIQLMETMLKDDYKENITVQLNDPNNRFLNLLNLVYHPVYKEKDFKNVKIILQVIIKASSDNLMRETFRSLLETIVSSRFCVKCLDINSDIFNADSIDYDLLFNLIKFYVLTMELIPESIYDKFMDRMCDLINEYCKNKKRIPKNLINLKNELIDLYTLLNKKTKNSLENNSKAISLPDNYRSISIYPESKDILDIQTKDVFIRENKIRGNYENVHDYLDVQFRLMREDFIQPLREGLLNYKNYPNQRNFDINVYKDITLNNMLPSERKGVIYTLSFDSKKFKKSTWIQSKRFMFGSLVMLSSDDFKTLIFGTIADINIEQLTKGLISVKFRNQKPMKNEKYIMVESKNLFEAYKHVLSRLQNITETNLCMKQYLVYTQTNIEKPKYLINGKIQAYSFDNETFNPNRNNNWPTSKCLKMNEPQYEAFKGALTNEITIIQGPPGTGKTYVGLKICKCLLENPLKQIKNFGPILIVCYTNHALDQFVEGISQFTDEIVRVGGRCKSEILDKFSINKFRQQHYTRNSRRKDIMIELKIIKKELLRIQILIDDSSTQLISVNSLEPFMEQDHVLYFQQVKINNWLLGNDISLYNSNFEEFLDRLFYEECFGELLIIASESLNELLDPKFDKQYDDDDDLEINFINNLRRLEDDYENDLNDIQKEMEAIRISMVNNYKPLRKELLQNKVDEDGFQKIRIKNTHKLFNKNLKSNKILVKEEVDKITDLSKLDIETRWKLYRYWRNLLTLTFVDKFKKLEVKFERLFKELEEINFERDRSIMSSKSIIAMTTTGAARYGDVLEMIQCKIIIIEEAAEVLESHIIGSLNRGCQHLILIGDHKQLKPNPSVFELCKRYNLDISLFERLINNNLNFYTLQIQHRMRPEISILLRHIYNNLVDDPSVLKYPNIPAIDKNVFFLTHNQFEDNVVDATSYSNKFEAEFIVKLCNHFIKNGIQNEKITILTLYSGQMFVIREFMKNNRQKFDKVRVCTVDNYQGEENDIIILSLVRSNDYGQIGFLKIENRICVSLSRAKHGLFIFGNANMFKDSRYSGIWKEVCKDLEDKGALGTCFKTICQIHPTKILRPIEKPSDFDLYPEGGCEKTCNNMLVCGHFCSKKCHFLDQDHKLSQCVKQCDIRFPCQHSCNGNCENCFQGRLHNRCKKGRHNFRLCGHNKIYCDEFLEKCYETCFCTCNHQQCLGRCYDECKKCMKPCNWKCPHKQCTNSCFEICNRDVCNERCNEILKCANCPVIFKCYGVCGEVCRKVCDKCDKSGFRRHFYGTELNKNAIFITLQTCDHSFEVTSFDKYMGLGENDEIVSNLFKICPKCSVKITQSSCYRYSNIIKSLEVKLNQIKRMINLYDAEKVKLRKFIFDQIESLNVFKQTVYIKNCINNLKDWINMDKRGFSEFEINQICIEFKRIQGLILINNVPKEDKILKFELELMKHSGLSIEEISEFIKKTSSKISSELEENLLISSWYDYKNEMTKLLRGIVSIQ